jgi:hypothetical protein
LYYNGFFANKTVDKYFVCGMYQNISRTGAVSVQYLIVEVKRFWGKSFSPGRFKSQRRLKLNVGLACRVVVLEVLCTPGTSQQNRPFTRVHPSNAM